MRHILPILLLLLAVQPAHAQPEAVLPAGARIVDYVRTIDGDTIVVRDGAPAELHVRLFGVDCPELKAGTPEAFAAAYWTARCLCDDQAAAVALEQDPVASTDSFGRTLAWVWFRPAGCSGWSLLNEGIVRSGNGTLYEACQSARYLDRLREALVWADSR